MPDPEWYELEEDLPLKRAEEAKENFGFALACEDPEAAILAATSYFSAIADPRYAEWLGCPNDYSFGEEIFAGIRETVLDTLRSVAADWDEVEYLAGEVGLRPSIERAINRELSEILVSCRKVHRNWLASQQVNHVQASLSNIKSFDPEGVSGSGATLDDPELRESLKRALERWRDEGHNPSYAVVRRAAGISRSTFDRWKNQGYSLSSQDREALAMVIAEKDYPLLAGHRANRQFRRAVHA